jgi:TonB family protein
MNTAQQFTRVRSFTPARAHTQRFDEHGALDFNVESRQGQLQSKASAHISITVLSTDAQLCQALRAAVDQRWKVFTAATLEEAAQFAATGKCSILVTDQVEQPSLTRITRCLGKHESALVTIAVGHRGEDNVLIGLMASGAADRLMLKPLTTALARIVLETAARDHLSRKKHQDYESRTALPRPLPTVVKRVAPPPSARPAVVVADAQANDHEIQSNVSFEPVRLEAPESSSELAAIVRVSAGRPNLMWLVLIIALFSIGALMWLAYPQRLPSDDTPMVVATTLSQADQAFVAGRYFEPPQDNALRHYAAVLALEPASTEAKSGIDRTIDAMLASAATLLEEGHLADSVNMLERVRKVRADHSGLPALEARVRAEVQKHLPQVPEISVAAAQPKLRGVRTSPHAPDQASAMPGVPDEPRVSSSESASMPAPRSQLPRPQVVGRAPQSVSTPASFAPASAEIPSHSTDTNLNESKGGTGENSLEKVGSVAPAMPAASTRSEPVSSAKVAQAEPVLPKPVPVKVVRPKYPGEARVRGIEGWVDISFEVSASGDVVAPRVEDSSMKQLFARPALAAVKQWKYEQRAASAASQREQVRVEFRLKE